MDLMEHDAHKTLCLWSVRIYGWSCL